MDNLPKGWGIHRIGDFFTESRISGTDGLSAKKITVKLFGKGVFSKNEKRKGSKNTKYYKRKTGQFIYSKLDFLNGAFGIIPPHLDDYESTIDLPAFDINVSIVSPQWSLYYISRENFYKSFEDKAKGGRKARRIQVDDFLEILIPLPPLPEQRKIAEILTTVDEKIESIVQRIEQTEQLKKGLMQRLFTRGIGHTEFKDTPIGRMPKEWELVIIRNLAGEEPNALTAGPFGTIFKAKDFRNEGIPIIQIRHITKDGFDWGIKVTYMDIEVYEKLHKPYTVKPGDLLITKLGEPPGMACLYPFEYPRAMVTPDVIKISINSAKADNVFIAYLYNAPSTRMRILNLTKGGTRTRVTLDEFYKLPIPLPPLPEQRQIASILSTVDEKLETLRTRKSQYSTLKKGLMQKLLTGRIRVKV